MHIACVQSIASVYSFCTVLHEVIANRGVCYDHISVSLFLRKKN